MTNAIKFTPQAGKVSITLGIVDTPRGKFVQVQFIDTGMGIRPEFLPHIFERFSQVDSSMARIHGGLGLGLAIAKSLVEMQQGTISVASEGEGRGATFAVQFPLIEPDRINKVDRPREPKLTLAPRLDGVKVLVVDDSTDNRLLFSVILKSFGAVVRLAESVEQGLNVLNEFAPDIILSDISMPIEDGFSFISRIRLRDERASRCVPVVALTAYAGPEDVRRMLDAGFAAHIAKPVDRSTMASAIAKLLKIQQG